MVAGGVAMTMAPVDAAPFPWEYDVAEDLLALPTDHAPSPVAVDWEGDGDLDLLVGFRRASQFGGIGVYLRGPDGELAPTPVPVLTNGNASTPTGFALYFRPAVGDWDGDGHKDLVYGQVYGLKGVVSCPNSGTDAAPVFDAGDCEVLQTSGGDTVGTDGAAGHAAYLSPELADLDDDGLLDLLVGSGGSADVRGVRLYRNVGTESEPALAEPEILGAKGSTPGLTYENYFEPSSSRSTTDGSK